MQHVKALAIKLPSIFVILWAILGGIFGVSIGNIVTFTFVFGLIEYIVGDLVLLRYTNNFVATMGDFGLALLMFWFMLGNMTAVNNAFTAAAIASIGVTVFEYFFHIYVERNVYTYSDDQQREPRGYMHYQTELSEEFHRTKRK